MQPEFAIINEKQADDFTVVTIDSKNATYMGQNWHTLGDFGKRKLENLLVLSRAKERIKVIYQ
jgi:hypothetical protein